MKCRLPVNAKQRSAIRSEVSAEMERQELQRTRRMYKMMCYALNRRFGFGAGRFGELVEYITDTLKTESDNDEFWNNVDRVVIDEIGVQFEREEI